MRFIKRIVEWRHDTSNKNTYRLDDGTRVKITHYVNGVREFTPAFIARKQEILDQMIKQGMSEQRECACETARRTRFSKKGMFRDLRIHILPMDNLASIQVSFVEVFVPIDGWLHRLAMFLCRCGIGVDWSTVYQSGKRLNWLGKTLKIKRKKYRYLTYNRDGELRIPCYGCDGIVDGWHSINDLIDICATQAQAKRRAEFLSALWRDAHQANVVAMKKFNAEAKDGERRIKIESVEDLAAYEGGGHKFLLERLAKDAKVNLKREFGEFDAETEHRSR